jgi:hypothetical protein
MGKKYPRTFARFSLFIIYFWFGLLKLAGKSPAGPLVLNLLHKTLPFMSPSQFMIFFALFEMLIGILFLFPRFQLLTVLLFCIHMVMTIMPLFLLPQETWSGILVPTLEGQYIIKNLALISVVWLLGFKRR